MHVGGSLEEIAAGERLVHSGRMPDTPSVLVCQQYLADPSRSRGDAHPVYSSSDRLVHVDGVRLRVRVAGDGSPLLLVADVGGDIAPVRG